MLKTIYVFHGPNLNLLGQREPDIYGHTTLEELNTRLIALGKEHGVAVTCFQSNHEGELIDRLQALMGQPDVAVIINPGGLTHSSVSLRDALAALTCPKIEVHLSNIYAREPFRQHSVISGAVDAVICGFGIESYSAAVSHLVSKKGN